jgi:hypothetical protein
MPPELRFSREQVLRASESPVGPGRRLSLGAAWPWADRHQYGERLSALTESPSRRPRITGMSPYSGSESGDSDWRAPRRPRRSLPDDPSRRETSCRRRKTR